MRPTKLRFGRNLTTGVLDISVSKDGTVWVESNDIDGGETFEWSRTKARKIAKFIIDATEKRR